MPNWVCEFCKAVNPPGRACELCGREKPGKAAAPAAPRGVRTCVWETRGARCLLMASCYKHAYRAGDRPDGYCSWHYLCLRDPGMADRFEAFEAYQLELLERSICCEFTHYPAAYVWAATRGTIRPMHERKAPVPCAATTCTLALEATR